MSRKRRSDRRLQPSSSQAATRLASERPLKPPRQMPRCHGRVRSQWLGDTRVPSVGSMLDLAIEWKPESRVLSRSRERSPHRFAHHGVSRRPNVEGDESEARYPAAEERGLAATNRAAGKMLLTDFCNHPLTAREPEDRPILERTAFAEPTASTEPERDERTERNVPEAPTHLAARQPRVEGRLTTRFQLRLARHRPRHRMDARMRAARTLPLVTAFSATNEVAQAQFLTPLSPNDGPDTRRQREADERPEPIPSPSRQCERSTPTQDAFHRQGEARSTSLARRAFGT